MALQNTSSNESRDFDYSYYSYEDMGDLDPEVRQRLFLNAAMFWIEGVAIAVVAAIGLGVNLFAIWRLSCGLKKRERHSFHHLLLSLTICDLLHITFNVICFALPQLSMVYRTAYLYAVPYLIPLAQMSLSCSSFTTVTLTVERYISLCWPYLRYRFDLKPRYYIMTVITFSVLYNTPRFFEWYTYSESYERPCLSLILQEAVGLGYKQHYSDYSEGNDAQNLNDTFFMDEAASMASTGGGLDLDLSHQNAADVLQSLDSETLKGLAMSDTILELENCTETFWNVTLLKRDLRKNRTYVLVYINWMNFIVNLMFPLATLLTLNASIYKALKKLRMPPVKDSSDKHRRSASQYKVMSMLSFRRKSSRSRGSSHAYEAAATSESPPHNHTMTSVTSATNGGVPDILPKSAVLSTASTKSRGHTSRSESMASGGRSPRLGTFNNSSRPGFVNPTNSMTMAHMTSTSTAEEEEAERDARYTRASILMVLVFGLCHAPRLITNTMEMFINQAHLPPWAELLVCVNHLLVTINSSFNFLIYLMASKRKKPPVATSPVFNTTTVARKQSICSGSGGGTSNHHHESVELRSTTHLVNELDVPGFGAASQDRKNRGSDSSRTETQVELQYVGATSTASTTTSEDIKQTHHHASLKVNGDEQCQQLLNHHPHQQHPNEGPNFL